MRNQRNKQTEQYMVCHRMSSSKEKVQQLRLVGTGVGVVQRWGCGMTSLMGPEVNRLFIDEGNSVPGRGSAGEKPLRWKESASVWKITEGQFSWGRESSRWNQRYRQGLIARSFISSLNLMGPFKSLWIGARCDLSSLGKITLAAEWRIGLSRQDGGGKIRRRFLQGQGRRQSPWKPGLCGGVLSLSAK